MALKLGTELQYSKKAVCSDSIFPNNLITKNASRKKEAFFMLNCRALVFSYLDVFNCFIKSVNTDTDVLQSGVLISPQALGLSAKLK